jgi:hypothetical protein
MDLRHISVQGETGIPPPPKKKTLDAELQGEMSLWRHKHRWENDIKSDSGKTLIKFVWFFIKRWEYPEDLTCISSSSLF